MGKFDKFLIATDLDGTLLNSRKRIDALTDEKIRYFIANGGHFTFATGRVHQSFVHLKDMLGFNAPVIFGNGGQIYDYETEQTLSYWFLPSKIRTLCDEVLKLYPSAALELYRHGCCDTVNENEITEIHVTKFGIERVKHDSLETVSDEPWIKVLITAPNSDLTEIYRYVTQRCDYANFRFSTAEFLEVFSRDTDKGRAALWLAKRLGVPESGLIAAGDQQNDLDLLNAAAISAAPANAAENVKAAVDIILPDNDHDAIAALIDHIDSIA
ncbi:MAG: HAD-IIB family hydrolase [Clostridia bacterium]|nr:HAD-IIB family hydrolase [Clostridia bacterium]